MATITVPESSLFLLLFAANIDAELTNGELTEDEESLILRCSNKWGVYDDFYSQEQMEAAIGKYQRFKAGSVDADDFIEQCAEVLITEPPLRDITYYLCNEILFMKGRPSERSAEMDLIGKLERILDVGSGVADFIFGQQVFEAILKS